MSTLNPIVVLGQMRDLARQDFGHANVVIRKAVDVLEMFINNECGAGVPGTSERLIVMGALREVLRARKLFPGNNLNILALCEEHGELIKACMDEKPDAIYKEGVQTIAMVIRVLTEGDTSTDQFRAAKALPPIVAQKVEPAMSAFRKDIGYNDQEEMNNLISDLIAMAKVYDINIKDDVDGGQWKVTWCELAEV